MPQAQGIIARACAPATGVDVIGRLAEGLGPGPFALVVIFMSPDADLQRLAAGSAARLPARQVVGCTTAGEISGIGYDDSSVVALGFPEQHFAAEVLAMPDLDRFSRTGAAAAYLQARQKLEQDHGHLPHEFAMLLVDGLSVKEDMLASALAAGAGSVPLIGGSAGDGTRFRRTFVMHQGRLMRNAAVLSVLRGTCPVRAMNMDHLQPTERRMVVTDADPAARIVRRLNAEPAAQEYARILGKDADRLDHLTFAAHPLAVRVGSRHHVRAIQQMLPSGDLVFFAAIDSGVVLNLTRPHDLVAHLDAELARLSQPAQPLAILAFDCILRRIEAQEKQMSVAVSDILRRNNVWGFSTYGEQFGPMHVNHTLTGCVFYPPGTILPGRGA